MKKIINIFILLLTLALFTACSSVSDEELIIAREAVKNGAIIVDVRTREEFIQKHIDGAINLPIEAIMKGSINLPKDKELVLYCRTGSRSSVSAKVLREKGWTVYDVATQDDWEREIK
ncbi:putative periplasmic rhodanese-like sulfurtransferase [Sulfurimonas gotlandica GD1]|uniref:Putative periplasmic rhodanese-like sulfurtransferase n=1 Tax=Sulfurimonas gotlandica (strain DSM 19862 / JCM 16533 / GD1) TaxID=929558 RepID=B6BNP9_SULGG|nr:rhodanese-like domain-containing protein [Sulfurimonas gotlandica]EDZ61194.1 phage shock protein E [Sulfurimonas gotlandica GD1]EHP28852.1 putative periplasmic rhodanese-like sulfurtransferase [Sulfurimonas gotlandica GD1]